MDGACYDVNGFALRSRGRIVSIPFSLINVGGTKGRFSSLRNMLLYFYMILVVAYLCGVLQGLIQEVQLCRYHVFRLS